MSPARGLLFIVLATSSLTRSLKPDSERATLAERARRVFARHAQHNELSRSDLLRAVRSDKELHVHCSYNDTEDKAKLAKIASDLRTSFGKLKHLGKTFRTLYLSARERGLVRGICDKLNDQGRGLERGGAQEGSNTDVFLAHYVCATQPCIQ